MNAIRRRHAALQHDTTLRFHATDNDRFVCWSKRDPQSGDAVLCIVNLDPDHAQEGWTDAGRRGPRARPRRRFTAVDLLGDGTYHWRGGRNYVRLDPHGTIAHVLAIRPGRRSRHAMKRAPDWYKDAIVYELHVRAFADSDGDGIGDFDGLTPEARLPARPRRDLPLAAARSTRRPCATTATTSPTTRA